MKSVIIREMKEEDWTRVAQIYQMGIDSNKATFVTECPSYESWDQAHVKSCRYVAVVDDTIAGFVALSPTSTRELYRGVVEVSIYLDDAYQNQGIGKMLMLKVIEASEAEGFWTIYSSIFVENEGSRRLHESCGFRLIGKREMIAKDRYGIWRDTVIYERRSKVII